MEQNKKRKRNWRTIDDGSCTYLGAEDDGAVVQEEREAAGEVEAAG